MGQKVSPTAIRLGITESWRSIWYAESDYADNLLKDIKVRELLGKKLKDAAIASIDIERPARTARITIKTARAGVLIGQKGNRAEALRDEVGKIVGVPVTINIEEVRKPELSAKLVAEAVAAQLEQRVMFRRAMKRAVSNTLRAGALGVKILINRYISLYST